MSVSVGWLSLGILLAMLRYFFHLQRQGLLIEDCEGGEFGSLEARSFALRSLREMMAADLRDGVADFSPQILIADSAGNIEAIVHVAEGLRLDGLEPGRWNLASVLSSPVAAPSVST